MNRELNTQVGAEWLTPTQAAEYLKVSVATVYRLTQKGTLPAFKVGRSRRYRREHLDALPTQLQPAVKEG